MICFMADGSLNDVSLNDVPELCVPTSKINGGTEAPRLAAPCSAPCCEVIWEGQYIRGPILHRRCRQRHEEPQKMYGDAALHHWDFYT
jgi:hypothetical protein